MYFSFLNLIQLNVYNAIHCSSHTQARHCPDVHGNQTSGFGRANVPPGRVDREGARKEEIQMQI